jgi:hypothetical protein
VGIYEWIYNFKAVSADFIREQVGMTRITNFVP